MNPLGRDAIHSATDAIKASPVSNLMIVVLAVLLAGVVYLLNENMKSSNTRYDKNQQIIIEDMLKKDELINTLVEQLAKNAPDKMGIEERVEAMNMLEEMADTIRGLNTVQKEIIEELHRQKEAQRRQDQLQRIPIPQPDASIWWWPERRLVMQ